MAKEDGEKYNKKIYIYIYYLKVYPKRHEKTCKLCLKLAFETQDTTKSTLSGPKLPQRELKEARLRPEELHSDPKGSPRVPKRAQRGPKGPKVSTKGAQRTPKGFKKSSKTTPK